MIIDNEKVYDEQIAPLMTQIIQICKDNKLPMFASFMYAEEQMCTTSISPETLKISDSQVFKDMWNKLVREVRKTAQVFAFTISPNK